MQNGELLPISVAMKTTFYLHPSDERKSSFYFAATETGGKSPFCTYLKGKSQLSTPKPQGKTEKKLIQQL